VFARFSASNWLLAAAAAWALGVAILALSGFGGRYRLYPDDPSLLPQLPSTVVQAARSPLGALELYAEAADRPLFYPDRKPVQARVGTDAAAQQPLNVVLTSIIITPTLRMAIVHDNTTNKSLRVREGKQLEGGPTGWKLVAVSRQQAIFESSQGRTTLDLRVFNGQGGEPPTPNGLTPQAVSAANIGNMFGNPPPANAAGPNMPPPAIPLAASIVPSPAAGNSDDAAADERRGLEAVARTQADSIRERIEARRKQAQDAAAAAPPPSEKVQ
jgi:general secretion pathway protein N